MSMPENADHSSHPLATGIKPHLLYKSLLIQRAQKSKKAAPVYQTQKEGSDHLPRFRSTVWVDGVSYTSSNTFQQRKNAEMDASRVAYIAITQKEKTDALKFVQKDKVYCKSVMADYAAKNNIGTPVYKTTQVEASLPVFRSNLIFNGETYPGNRANSKKEAEQLAARSVIIKFLASESGTDMADVVNSKLRQYQEINNVQIGSHAAVLEPIIPQHSVDQTAPTVSVAAQQPTPKSVSQVARLVTQPPTPHASISIKPVVDEPHVSSNSTTASVKAELNQVMHPVVTQQPFSQVSVEPIKPLIVVAEPLVLTPVPSAGVSNLATANVTMQPKAEPQPDQQLISQVLVEPSKPVVDEPLPFTPPASALVYNSATANEMIQPKAEPDQQPTSQVLVEPIKPVVVAQTLVLNQIPSALINKSAAANVIKQPKVEFDQQPMSQVSVEPFKAAFAEALALFSTPVPSDIVNNSAAAIVIKEPKVEPMECILPVEQASDKKRSRTSKKDVQKRMRGSIQMPATSQVLPFAYQ